MEGQNKDTLLPQDIVDDEILPRLDVKSLLKFRCVSKSWRSLIDSKRFIKAHHKNSMKNPSFPHQRLILESEESWPEQSPLLNEPDFDPFQWEEPYTPFVSFRVVGCCNGLVCILREPYTLFMWNPSTRIVKKLPKISGTTRAGNCGFGWVESSDEYKVYAVFHFLYPGSSVYKGYLKGYLYSSKTKSWKATETKTMGSGTRDVGVFVDEKLHYQRYGEDIIEFFDLKSEVLGTIEMPAARCKNGDRQELLGVLGDRLCFLLYNYSSPDYEVLEVWVMKEYGVRDCWIRVVARDHVLKLLRQPRSAPSFVGPDGEILLFFYSAIFVYYPQENVFRFHENFTFYNSRHLCIESLESPEDV